MKHGIKLENSLDFLLIFLGSEEEYVGPALLGPAILDESKCFPRTQSNLQLQPFDGLWLNVFF